MKKKLLSTMAIALALSVSTIPALAAPVAEPAANTIAMAETKEEVVNSFGISGFKDVEALRLDVVKTGSYQFKLKSTVLNAGQIHWGFYDSEYFRVEVKDSRGTVVASTSVTGAGSVVEAAKYLDGLMLFTGDTIYVSHKESNTRLKVLGTVTDAPRDLSQSFGGPTYGQGIGFRISNNNLRYVVD